VVPQLAAPSSAHIPIGSVLPAGRLAHIPSLPGTPQLWHDGHDAEPQQNPLMQLPVAHCASLMQLTPLPRLGTHAPPLQNETASH
jgi:hypothetical protein